MKPPPSSFFEHGATQQNVKFARSVALQALSDNASTGRTRDRTRPMLHQRQ
jgi:hypothetical protein